ncbi:MAG: lipid A deacylase LpxR family protein [Gemmatimonadota bacterium]|nr:lipid A deacylase LpxR family protein [Gemmatimonadota bacterium]
MAVPAPSRAQKPDDTSSGTAFGLRIDNDTLAGTDRCYTGGLTLHWVQSPERPEAGGIRNFLAGGDPDAEAGLHITLSQAIYTPDNIRRSDVIPDDRPYAGLLMLRVAVPVIRETRADLYTVSVGVAGPASGAEQTQTWIHRATGNVDPAGWQHQLGNEPVVQLRWDRRWQGLALGGGEGFGVRLTPHVDVGLGTLSMDAGLGGTVRAGWNVAPDPGWRSIRPGGGRAPGSRSARRLRVELHATVGGRLVARNLLLDGNNFRDSHSVERSPATADAVFGAEVGLGRVNLLYELVFWTRKFETESRNQAYSSIALRLN